MKSALVTRLKRLEGIRAVQCRPPVEFQFGYVIEELPREYTGERHLVAVGQLPDGKYQWEERPGSRPADEDHGEPCIIVHFRIVEPKGRRPVRASSAEQNEIGGPAHRLA